jgi:hypothetical protein
MDQPDPNSRDTTPSGSSATPSPVMSPVGDPQSNAIEHGVPHSGAFLMICAAVIFVNEALNRSVEPAGMIVGISYGYSTLLATWFVLGKSPYCTGGSLTLGCALNLFVPILFVIIYAGDMPAGIFPVSFTYVVLVSASIFSYTSISRIEVRHRRDISEEYSEKLPFGIRDLIFATGAAAVAVAVGKALFMLSNDQSGGSVSGLFMTTPFFFAMYWPMLINALTEGQRLSKSVFGFSFILILNFVELSACSSMMGLRTVTEKFVLLGSFNAPFLVVVGTHLAIVRLCGYRLVTRAEARSDESMQDFKD